MTRNMGTLDRMIRLIIAIAIAFLYALGYITATWAVWLFGIIAAVLLVTSVIGFCPLYTLFGISTNEPTLHQR